MRAKPITPYARLLREVMRWAHSAKYRHTVTMCVFPKEKLGGSWRVDDIYERTIAAKALGYDVMLEAKDDGLHVRFVKRVPEIPFGWQ